MRVRRSFDRVWDHSVNWNLGNHLGTRFREEKPWRFPSLSDGSACSQLGCECLTEYSSSVYTLRACASLLSSPRPSSIPLLEQIMSHTPSLTLLQRKELRTSQEENPKPIESLCPLRLPRRLIGALIPLGRGDQLPLPAAADPGFTAGVLPPEPVFAGSEEGERVSAEREGGEREGRTARSAAR